MKRIGILTSGGDCPGLNAVIRAVVKKANQDHGYEVIGIEDGFEGLIHNRTRKLTDRDVSGILTQTPPCLSFRNRTTPPPQPPRTHHHPTPTHPQPPPLPPITPLCRLAYPKPTPVARSQFLFVLLHCITVSILAQYSYDSVPV